MNNGNGIVLDVPFCLRSGDNIIYLLFAMLFYGGLFVLDQQGQL